MHKKEFCYSRQPLSNMVMFEFELALKTQPVHFPKYKMDILQTARIVRRTKQCWYFTFNIQYYTRLPNTIEKCEKLTKTKRIMAGKTHK